MDESSLQVHEIIDTGPSPHYAANVDDEISALKKFDKVLTDRGFCYTTNMQNHDVLFNDIISSDFDSYKRNLVKQMKFNLFLQPHEELFNDSVQWTMEKGYPTGNKSCQII